MAAAAPRFRRDHRGRRHGRRVRSPHCSHATSDSRRGGSRSSSRPLRAPRRTGVVDLRVSALSRASERILRHAGAWAAIEAERLPVLPRWWSGTRPAGSTGAIRCASRPPRPASRTSATSPRTCACSGRCTESPHVRDVTQLRAGLEALEFDDESARVTLSDGRRYSVRAGRRRGRRPVADARAVRHRPRRLDVRPDRGGGAPAHRAAAPRHGVAALPAGRAARVPAAARRARVAGVDDDAGGGCGAAGARAGRVRTPRHRGERPRARRRRARQRSRRLAARAVARARIRAPAPGAGGRRGAHHPSAGRPGREPRLPRLRASLVEVLGDAVAAGGDPFGPACAAPLRALAPQRERADARRRCDTSTACSARRASPSPARAALGMALVAAAAALRGARSCSARSASRATCPPSSLDPGNLHDRPELAAGAVHPGRAGTRQPVPRRSAARPAGCGARCRPTCSRAVEPELDELGALAGGELYRLQLADRLNEPSAHAVGRLGQPRRPARGDAAVARGRAAHGASTASSRRPTSARSARHARIAQFAKVYLFHPSSDVYYVPARDDRRRRAHAARVGQRRR